MTKLRTHYLLCMAGLYVVGIGARVFLAQFSQPQYGFIAWFVGIPMMIAGLCIMILARRDHLLDVMLQNQAESKGFKFELNN